MGMRIRHIEFDALDVFICGLVECLVSFVQVLQHNGAASFLSFQHNGTIESDENRSHITDRRGIHKISSECSHVADGGGGNQLEMFSQLWEIPVHLLRFEQIGYHRGSANAETI